MGSVGGVNKVFVYGSLMAEEVLGVLLKRIPSSSPAILHHFHRYSIKGRVYPAILPVENNSSVLGKVLLEITDSELRILDDFEDFEYERRLVKISTSDTLEKHDAYTYVWSKENDPDLHGEWSFDDWKQVHMKDFVGMTVGFMEEREQPEHRTRVAMFEPYYEH